MKRTLRVFSILFALALVLGFSLVTTTPALAAATLTVNTGLPNVPPNYWTIQAAVNAANPGDTINVAAGTYVEAVNVNKSLTLRGTPSAGGVPLSIIRPDGSTPLYDSGVRRVAIHVGYGPPYINGVTIDGFEIDGTATTVHVGILLGSSNGSTVKNNVIHDINTGGDNSAGVGVCVFGWGQGTDGTLIEGNTVYQTGRMGIFIGGMQSVSPWSFLVSSNNTVRNNTVYQAWQGPTTDYGGAVQINGARNSLIQGNTIYNTGLSWYGIYICGSVSPNYILGNNVHNNNVGIMTYPANAGVNLTPFLPGGPEVHYNNIYSNAAYGLRNYDPVSPPVVNATCNWWGAASGPGMVGPGTGDKVSNNVTYSPWLNQPYPNAPQQSVTPITGGTAYFGADQGNFVGLQGVTPPSSPPVTLPYGMFNFTVCCIPSGATVTLNVTLPGPVPVGTKWWKYYNGSWYPLGIGHDDGDNFIMVTLRDGIAPEDEDTTPGQITDQGGPGFGGAVGWETYAVSKVRVVLPWFALLAVLVLASSLLALRHRQTRR